MPKKKFIGQCRLCLEQKELVDSHIIPRFQYKPLKKREGHFLIIPSDLNEKELKEQRGFTEPLFCGKCDNVRLQKNEDHLARVFFGSHPVKSTNHGQLLVINGFDYKKVKNGLLSILWRMSLSSHKAFKKVELGDKHEEQIRNIIWNEMNISEDEYPILLTLPILGDKFYPDWILSPDVVRFNNYRAYRCLISGFLFTFLVGSAVVPQTIKPLFLHGDGSWLIDRPKIEEIPFLFEACLELKNQMKLRRVT